ANTTHAHPNSTNCGNGTCSAGEEASWNLGSIPPGSTRTLHVNANVQETVEEGDELRTYVRVSANGLNPANVTKVVPVVVAPPAELSLTASADPVTPGQTVELVVDLGHVGGEHL